MTLASLRWFTSSTQDFPFKRHKVPRACQQCRRKKIRCDGKKPCGRCVQQSLECSYAEQQPRAGGRRRSSDPVSKNATNTTSNTAAAAASSSPPCRQPLSPSPSPSPKQQQHQQQRHHFVRERLDRISFSDDLYSAMSIQYNNDSIIHRSQLFNNNKCLPPLMYDFFHFTSQPHTIWSTFIRRFKHYHRIAITQQQSSSQQETTTSAIRDLLEEALTIFERHHLLYSSLFDIENLRNNTLCPQFLSHMNNVPNTKDATTLFAILGLVFRAAFQSLAILLSNDMATTLEHCAAAFAQEAQHRFLRMTFFETATSKDTETLFGLVAVAILLTHYLCTALCQENAYMVLHLGIAYASRCSLGARIKAFDSQHGRKNNKRRNNSTKRITEDRWRKMYIVLNAWQIWMSFYLHRDMTDHGGNLVEIARDCPLSSEKDWALHAVVDYVDFLQRITHTETDCMDIKYEMDQLAQKTGICNIKETNLPACTLSLFHHVLSIQLFSCQQQDDPCKTTSNNNNERMILDVCGSSAAKIVDIIDGLTMEYHAPMTKTSKQHDPINTAVLYPLCLATSTISTLYSLHHHHHPTSTTINNKRGSSQKSSIPDTNLPIFKLRRLLNPICSQVSAASVISSTLDEIQAAVRRSSTSCSRSSSSSSGTLTTTTTTTSTTLSQQEEQQLHPSSEEMTWQLDSTHLEQQQDANDNGRNLAEDEDDILLPDDLFRSSTTRYMYPARNEVDRQQLDKLFHNKDLRSNSAIATYHHHGNGATQGVDFGGGITTAPTPSLSISERGQKRRFASSTMPVKRTRGSMDALSCYGNEQTTMPTNPNTFPVPDQLAEEPFVGFPSYTDDGGFLLMDIQANAIAAAAATVTNFNSERDNPSTSSTTTAATTTRPTIESASSGGGGGGGGVAPPLPPPSSSSTSSSEPFITGILEDNDDSIPRQLPPPPKHQQQMPKNWSAISHQQQQRNRDEPFQASVLETLHPNTLGSTSTTATMGMYPIVQSNQQHHHQHHQQQLYSSTTTTTAQQHQQQQGGTGETEGDDHNMVPYFFNMGNPLAQPTTTTPNAWMAPTNARSKMPTSSSQPSSSTQHQQHPSWRNVTPQQQNPSFAAGVRQHHHQRGILNHQGHPTAAAQWLQMPPTAAAAAAAVAAAAANDKMLPVTANDMLATWPNG